MPLHFSLEESENTNIKQRECVRNLLLFVDIVKTPYILSNNINHCFDGVTSPARDYC